MRNEENISEEVFEEKTVYLKELAIEKFQMDIADLELQQIVPAQRIDWIASAFYVVHNEYIVLLVSFALSPLVSYSFYSRKEENKEALYRTISSWAITILWGLIAYFYHNAFVGFLAVGAFISSIGFYFFMNSHMMVFGFKKENAPFVLRLTIFTFCLTILSWLIFYTNYIPALSVLKPYLRVFETGMTSLIPMVSFIGLFYINYLYKLKENPFKKVVLESIALIAAIGVLIIALVYGIGSMFWIGLFFTVWFSMDKFYWLVYQNAGLLFAALILAGLLAGIGYGIKSNLPLIMEHLEFLNL